MKKCPYCTEDIKKEAIVCKHCNREQPKPKTDYKKVIKMIVIIALVLLSFVYWYLTIPAVIIWFLWRSKRLTQKVKRIAMAVIAVVFLILGISNNYAARTPTITIADPADGTSIQAESITINGRISPKKSSVTADGQLVEVDSKGVFSFEARLVNEINAITIAATNGDKDSSASLTINRIFTEEEVAQRAKQKEEEKKLNLEKSAKARAELKVQEREKQIKDQFSSWNGSHDVLTNIIKASMNDPKSYKHVETSYLDKEDHLIVITTFRGKNAFGGIVANTVKAKVSLDGQVIEIIEQY